MKTHALLAILLFATASWLPAQGDQNRHGARAVQQQINSPSPGDDLAALEQFLAMDDASLDRMQQAITRVRSMSPSERAELRKRIAEYRNLPTSQREKIRTGWGWTDDNDRNDWPAMMRSLPDAERTAIQERLRNTPADQLPATKHEILEALRNRGK